MNSNLLKKLKMMELLYCNVNNNTGLTSQKTTFGQKMRFFDFSDLKMCMEHLKHSVLSQKQSLMVSGSVNL
jgi:hypothetical protein